MNDYQKIVSEFLNNRKLIKGSGRRSISPSEITQLIKMLENPNDIDDMPSLLTIYATTMRVVNINSNLYKLASVLSRKSAIRVCLIDNYMEYTNKHREKTSSYNRASYLNRLRAQIKNVNKKLGGEYYSLELRKLESVRVYDMTKCYLTLNIKGE